MSDRNYHAALVAVWEAHFGARPRGLVVTLIDEVEAAKWEPLQFDRWLGMQPERKRIA